MSRTGVCSFLFGWDVSAESFRSDIVVFEDPEKCGRSLLLLMMRVGDSIDSVFVSVPGLVDLEGQIRAIVKYRFASEMVIVRGEKKSHRAPVISFGTELLGSELLQFRFEGEDVGGSDAWSCSRESRPRHRAHVRHRHRLPVRRRNSLFEVLRDVLRVESSANVRHRMSERVPPPFFGAHVVVFAIVSERRTSLRGARLFRDCG